MRVKTSKVDAKGRVSIPFHLRNMLCIKPGDSFTLKTNEKNEIILVPIKENN